MRTLKESLLAGSTSTRLFPGKSYGRELEALVSEYADIFKITDKKHSALQDVIVARTLRSKQYREFINKFTAFLYKHFKPLSAENPKYPENFFKDKLSVSGLTYVAVDSTCPEYYMIAVDFTDREATYSFFDEDQAKYVAAKSRLTTIIMSVFSAYLNKDDPDHFSTVFIVDKEIVESLKIIMNVE